MGVYNIKGLAQRSERGGWMDRRTGAERDNIGCESIESVCRQSASGTIGEGWRRRDGEG